ncbi:helix-turn-helix domain-containing protein [Streptomyces sp. NPDC002870]|uniref:helix-turn-helix domain-containing protein n=1 Tax=Streptomyces sp. NPDC002870 TaxID=3364666 RepID=UPI003681AAA2
MERYVSQALPEELLPEERALYEELRRLRHSTGVSLEALARGTGYSRASWHRVFNGIAFPPRDALAKLCARRRLDATRPLQLWDQADAARLRRATATPTPTIPEPEPSSTPAPASEKHSPEEDPATAPADSQDTPSPPATSPAAPVPHAATARLIGRLPFRRRWLVLLAVLALIGGWYQLPGPSDTTTDDSTTARRHKRTHDPQPSSPAATKSASQPSKAPRSPTPAARTTPRPPQEPSGANSGGEGCEQGGPGVNTISSQGGKATVRYGSSEVCLISAVPGLHSKHHTERDQHPDGNFRR